VITAGSPPDPAGGAYSAPPDTLAVFKGAILLKGKTGGDEKGKEGKGEAKEQHFLACGGLFMACCDI